MYAVHATHTHMRALTHTCRLSLLHKAQVWESFKQKGQDGEEMLKSPPTKRLGAACRTTDAAAQGPKYASAACRLESRDVVQSERALASLICVIVLSSAQQHFPAAL